MIIESTMNLTIPIYSRFLATGTVEEKIFQRQLSKEGLQSIVDDKEQVNELSTKDLRNLFKMRSGTPSDTHDKLRCERCETYDDNAEKEALKVLPKQLTACKDLLEIMSAHEDAKYFAAPLKPTEHNVTTEEYEKHVKQPMDLGTIKKKLYTDVSLPNSYKKPSEFSKDVNRIFTNVMKVWEPGCELADASRRLQSWWTEQWTQLVPRLMSMKPDDEEEKAKACNNEDENNEIDNCAYVHNERGEDFQEQLGMPDEENMRHWSHHHTSDTVDDPVFRAAMRGFDSVSFVFGLEVTWSLIQERQQEEEEKAALKELEAAQELGCIDECEDEDDDDEGEDQKKPSKKKDTVVEKSKESKPVPMDASDSDSDDDDDATWNLFATFTKEQITSNSSVTCESDGCGNVACSHWKSDKDEEMKVCLKCQDEEFDGWPSGLEPKDQSLRECIEQYCTKPKKVVDMIEESSSTDVEMKDAIVENDVSEPEKVVCEAKPEKPQDKSPSEKKSTPKKKEWECGVCTYLNPNRSKKCKMCKSPKELIG